MYHRKESVTDCFHRSNEQHLANATYLELEHQLDQLEVDNHQWALLPLLLCITLLAQILYKDLDLLYNLIKDLWL